MKSVWIKNKVIVVVMINYKKKYSFTTEERVEMIKDVEKIIRTELTPLQQQIIEEREYKGRDIEEIAKRLDMQPTAVRMQLSRARKKIREIYKTREL